MAVSCLGQFMALCQQFLSSFSTITIWICTELTELGKIQSNRKVTTSPESLVRIYSKKWYIEKKKNVM